MLCSPVALRIHIGFRSLDPVFKIGSPAARQHAFTSGMTLSSGLCIPRTFRWLALASCSILLPLRSGPFLTVRLLITQTSLGFSFSA